MTDEMLSKSRSTAAVLGFDHVEFRQGLAESLPVGDGWADVVVSNGVINLCADNARSSLICIASCGRPVIWNSPISRTGGQCLKRQFKALIFGQLESPVVCRVQPGSGCWSKSASLT